MRSLDDKALLQRIVERREEALSELYDRYASVLLGLSQRILHNLQTAEEVLQEVMLYVWDHASRYEPSRSSPSTWLVLLARSRAIDRLRKRRVVERTLEVVRGEKVDHHTSPDGVDDVLSQERRQRIDEELGKLPAEQRQVVELAFFRGMSQSEIAAAHDIPLGTVKTRSLLAMRKLRKALEPEIEELL